MRLCSVKNCPLDSKILYGTQCDTDDGTSHVRIRTGLFKCLYVTNVKNPPLDSKSLYGTQCGTHDGTCHVQIRTWLIKCLYLTNR